MTIDYTPDPAAPPNAAPPAAGGAPAAAEPGDGVIARLPALHGRQFVLDHERVSLEGSQDGWPGWSIAFLPQIAAVRIGAQRKDRGSLVWGIIGAFAALGVWQIASNQAVSTGGGLFVGLISLILLGEFFLRPPDLALEIILGTEVIRADIKRSQAAEARAFANNVLDARNAALAAHQPSANGATPASTPHRNWTPRIPLP